MASPILTIGITTYERPESLRRAVDSVLGQDGVDSSDVEMVVVDDASRSEAAISYLSQLTRGGGEQFPIRVIRHAEGSGGPSTGRNDIIEAASGTYVLFLDDDNLLAPGSLSSLVDYLSSSSMDWVSLRRNRHGKSFHRAPEGHHENLSRRAALWTFLICGAFRRSTIDILEIGFNPDVSYGEDSEFVLELVTKSDAFATLSDRDYIIESDPQSGELPHISHLPPGADFVRTIIAHVGRLFAVITRSSLEPRERDELAKLILIRSLGSYKLDRKIVGLRDTSQAEELLAQWSELIQAVVTAEQVSELAVKRGNMAVLDAVVSSDLHALRIAIDPGE